MAYSAAQQIESVRNGLVVIAGIITSLGVITFALKKPLRWFARRNVSDPFAQWLKRTVTVTVAPMFEDAKAQSKAQHDEQNVVLESQNVQIAAIAGQVADLRAETTERLDNGAVRFAALEAAQAVLDARSPDTRTRKDDPA